MLFNSYQYIFAFLPVTILVYFLLNKNNYTRAAQAWLVAASLFFYSWWNIKYLPLILTSVIVNYLLGKTLSRAEKTGERRLILTVGLVFNIGLLGYFKYTDFFLANLNLIFSANIRLLEIALPLAISFFTFQQIAYLVDAYRGETKEYDFLNYVLFVTFFPQLIAGPIVHHREMMPQFLAAKNRRFSYQNLAIGLFIFCIGLFKKVIIADTFAHWASFGFDSAPVLSLIEAWAVSLSYTFQLYYDFSGYTDMAIGAALMLNINLPVNFNSPYKALNIQDFWRRWHMTLSRFLRDYIYIPLGGNRRGQLRLYTNLMITFLIGGLWHGAGWTFVFWGFLHGLALIIHRLWQKLNINLNRFLAWFITFNFVNAAWVFFRAETWADAIKVLKGMLGLSGVTLPASLAGPLGSLASYGVAFQGWILKDLPQLILLLAIIFIITLGAKNSVELKNDFRPRLIYALFAGLIGLIAITQLTSVSEFLYFNF